MTPPSVLFDLDGTLTDSKPGIVRSIHHALRTLGHVPPESDDLSWCIGPPLRQSFARLLATSDRAQVEQALAIYRERFSSIGLFENSLYPHIPESLKALTGLGYRIFLATSKPRVFAVRILEHFGLTELFDHIYGSELDGSLGAKGELIRHILDSEKLHPARTLMVGDREYDVYGARENGLPCLGVTYGFGTRTELEAAGATGIVAAARDIPDAVQTLLSV